MHAEQLGTWFLYALYFSIGVVALALFQLVRAEKVNVGTLLAAPMGLPTWDFSKSWAANLTTLGAIVGAALSLGVLPTGAPSKPYYIGFHLLCLALLAAAPFLYNACRVGRLGSASGGDPVAYHGFVGVFLLASLATAWGLLGQLATLWRLLRELARDTTGSPLLNGVFAALVFVLFFAALAYLNRTIYWTVRGQRVQPPATNGLAPSGAALAKWAIP